MYQPDYDAPTHADLFRGPIGRRLLRRLSFFSTDTRHELLLSAVGLASEVLRLVSDDTDTTLAEGAESDASPYLADEVLAAEGTRWWWRPLDFDAQCHREHKYRRPLETPTPANASMEPSRPDWGFWTSTAIDGVDMWSMSGQSIGLGQRLSLRPPLNARVYEIWSPRDWVKLCRNLGYVAADGLLVPDWQRVASRYDAVHLGMSGLIAVQGRDLSLYGVETLKDWDCESTCWFDIKESVLV